MDFLASLKDLETMGFNLYATFGTADFYFEHGVTVHGIEWPFDSSENHSKNGSSNSGSVSSRRSSVSSQPLDSGVNTSLVNKQDNIGDFIAEQKFDLIINVPTRNGGARRVSMYVTKGYKTRRMAVDHGIPLITDVKCAKVLVEGLKRFHCKAPALRTDIDCITSRRIITLPGLIDVHVHMREPGAAYKEDWASGTAAALAGGVTMLVAMPNTKPSVVDLATLETAYKCASRNARCDFGLFVGASEANAHLIPALTSQLDNAAGDACGVLSASAVKMYLNDTFSTLKLTNMVDWMKHFELCPRNIPLCVHAEGHTMGSAILLAEMFSRHLHVCHVSLRDEIELIKLAKSRNVNITCEVCPHHLFLTQEQLNAAGGCCQSAGRSEVRPRLATSEDQEALWNNLDVIDCFATDHAPHTPEEKDSSNPPPGFPGLETMVPLLLTAVHQGRLTIEQLVQKLHHNPRRIFNLPEQNKTFVEIDLDHEWTIPSAMPYSKAKWTPFAGMKVKGAIRRVVLRGEVVCIDGAVVAKPGYGLHVKSLAFHAQKRKEPSTSADVVAAPMASPFGTGQFATGSPKGGIMATKSQGPAMKLSAHLRSIPDPLNVNLSQEGAIQNVLHSPVKKFIAQTSQGTPVAQSSVSTPVHGSSMQQYVVPLEFDLRGKHILTVTQFSRQLLHHLFELAHVYRMQVALKRDLTDVMKGKSMALLFYEASTRTSCSFSCAFQRMGGNVIELSEKYSSHLKGESLMDTVSVMSGYVDVVVMRHPEVEAVSKASKFSRGRPMINAGDGTGEHPTQALLDVFTIREEVGTVNGLKITMVGDLKHGRTVHSLAKLLCHYNVSLRYVSPPNLRMPEAVKSYVSQMAPNNVTQTEVASLEEALPDTDVLYMTRIQKERFEDQQEYLKSCNLFRLTPQLMTKAKDKMIVMHPLPRLNEISPEVDSDPRAVYFRQAEFGMYVRMALLSMIIENKMSTYK